MSARKRHGAGHLTCGPPWASLTDRKTKKSLCGIPPQLVQTTTRLCVGQVRTPGGLLTATKSSSSCTTTSGPGPPSPWFAPVMSSPTSGTARSAAFTRRLVLNGARVYKAAVRSQTSGWSSLCLCVHHLNVRPWRSGYFQVADPQIWRARSWAMHQQGFNWASLRCGANTNATLLISLVSKKSRRMVNSVCSGPGEVGLRIKDRCRLGLL